MDFTPFVFAVLIAFPLAILKGIRWKLILHIYGMDIGLRDCVQMYTVGMTLSAITQGRLGDLIKILILIIKLRTRPSQGEYRLERASNCRNRGVDIPV